MTDSPIDWLDDGFDRPKEACGVVGYWTRKDSGLDVAKLCFFGLYALQHRGQESCGIAVTDGNLVHLHRGMGLVSQVFHEENLAPMTGHIAMGHTRYSTTGSNNIANTQPFHLQTLHGPLSVAHNGNITNAGALRKTLMERGVGLVSTTDTEVITQFLAAPPPFKSRNRPHWEERLVNLLQVADGAYSLVIMTQDALFALRDPHGLRPLCVGHIKGDDGKIGGWVVASESSALLTVGAKHLREVKPGEIVRIDARGIQTVHELPARKRPKPALCIFEYVYFARPDSRIQEQTVHVVRQRMGVELAKEAPAEADVVFGVPDSSLPSAMAYAETLGLPYTEGLIKNRYIGRTFIQPSERMRRDAVRLKFNAVRENLAGKRVVVIDDSIVRGTTMGPLVKLIREAGKAKEVHLRIAAPPIKHPCFMGVDLASHDELIAHNKTLAEICKHVGADSLAYLSLEGLHRAVSEGKSSDTGHCDACFSGAYPVDVSEWLSDDGSKHQFETVYAAVED